MRSSVSLLVLVAVLAGCGSGGQNGGASGSPTVSPVTPIPPPPPPTYPRFADLAGDQSFRTACTALVFNGVPPQARVATPFGNGLTLNYTAASNSYVLAGDGVTSSFGPLDVDPAAPAGTQSYVKNVAGFTERFTIGRPSVNGIQLNYVRGFALTVRSASGPQVQYQCAFGVPTLTTDVPSATTVTYPFTAVNGVAYVNAAGAQQVYLITTSQATLDVNLSTGTVTMTLRLRGILQTSGGPSGSEVALGDYTGSVPIDVPAGSYYGSLAPQGGPNGAGSFGGWFFGPQGEEAGLRFSIAGTLPGTTNALSVAGAVNAYRLVR